MNAFQPNTPVPARKVESIDEAPSAEAGTDPLSDAKKRDRDRLLRQYWKLEGGWFDVASTLMELRNKRLYRESHPTFEAFCLKELGMTRANVNRRIQSSEVALHLETNVAKPAKEAHT